MIINYKNRTWDIILLVLRIWIGYRLIAASFSSVTGIISSEKERAFFMKWFGEELHFPFPLVMAFLAKGSELAGGIFVIIGLFTKPFSILIAFTMLVATLTANLGENFIIDGGFTISYFLFAIILLFWGAGIFSLDQLFHHRKKNTDTRLRAVPQEN